MSEAFWIGLCGRSGSGKGYVASRFLTWGIPSVDTDAVYRAMTGPSAELSPCMRELCAVFGNRVVCPDGSLDRRAMSEIVFAEDGAHARLTLNRITHRYILAETRRAAGQWEREGAAAVLIDAPLLFESGFDAFCRYTVCVVASEEASLARILRRDGISREEAGRRLAAQMTNEELIRRCDFAVYNELEAEDLEGQIRRIVGAIREKEGMDP